MTIHKKRSHVGTSPCTDFKKELGKWNQDQSPTWCCEVCGSMQLTLVALQGSSCSLFLAALCDLQSSLESCPWTVPPFRDGFCCCLCFLPWNVLFLDVRWLAESFSVYLYVQDMSVQFENPVHLDSISCFLLSLPTQIDKSSRPSVFDWNKIDQWATQGCRVAAAAAWHKYCLPLPRNSIVLLKPSISAPLTTLAPLIFLYSFFII